MAKLSSRAVPPRSPAVPDVFTSEAPRTPVPDLVAGAEPAGRGPWKRVGARAELSLNGIWDFEQTADAFPPRAFSRRIEVPGLIHLAEPHIEAYDKMFKQPGGAEQKENNDLRQLDYQPRYSWYRVRVFVPKALESHEGVLSLKKSQYSTQLYVNGMDAGASMSNNTPVEANVTPFLRYGEENEILVRVGERIWLPSEAAGGTDNEKAHYIPGIWDDVGLSFTGKLRINRLLPLPSLKNGEVTVKVQVRSFLPPQIHYGDPMVDHATLVARVFDRATGKMVAEGETPLEARRDNLSEVNLTLPIPDAKPWTPESPNLYETQVSLKLDGVEQDTVSRRFGMRDFERRGKHFYLNGERLHLRGSNITLQRFFEDPESSNLAWDRAWVKRLLVDYPHALDWNAMRICVGVVPDFWYDLADEHGLLLQNEWLHWQNHGWDDQIRKEYTDWVWTDGSHPSIAIWDAINENKDDFIGNKLIPELKQLDPTRVWDAGYMTGDDMTSDEMDEPHAYMGPLLTLSAEKYKKDPYPLGDLDYRSQILKDAVASPNPQLVNEYGWNWLWRDGQPSYLTVNVYDHYLGPHSTVAQRRELQAYWMQLETELLRSERSLAGVLSFALLTNNYGFTGDWFVGKIRDLQPGPTLQWFRHAFAPAAVFINRADSRYTPNSPPAKPGSSERLELVGINDGHEPVAGKLDVCLYDSQGERTVLERRAVTLGPDDRTPLSVDLKLPTLPGGYLVTAELTLPGSERPLISRRFLKVGTADHYDFFDLQP